MRSIVPKKSLFADAEVVRIKEWREVGRTIVLITSKHGERYGEIKYRGGKVL